ATFTGAIIMRFEDALASYVVLTAYIPMLMDTAGNAGGQASVSIIRGLSLGEIRFEDMLKTVFKEFRVSILCGITLSLANFAKLLVIDHLAIPVAAVVCSTLVLVVICAKLVGCSLPLLAKKIGFDPAVMASPMVTTIVDAISLFVYFNIATYALHLNIS
ncbi:MAG: magnesium transporter, partial [Butyrivibrio sp.]|nr:magnesium transporter [Butyrivibrio sp.]